MRRTKLLLSVCLVGGLAACGPVVMESRMKSAPPRAEDCALELVEADMMELSPLGTKWDYLGTVSVSKVGSIDPTDARIRALIRPKACGLGGTAVALLQSMNAAGMMGSGSGLSFAVLRPKSAPSTSSRF
jgi:hypothetical protein